MPEKIQKANTSPWLCAGTVLHSSCNSSFYLYCMPSKWPLGFSSVSRLKKTEGKRELSDFPRVTQLLSCRGGDWNPQHLALDIESHLLLCAGGPMCTQGETLRDEFHHGNSIFGASVLHLLWGGTSYFSWAKQHAGTPHPFKVGFLNLSPVDVLGWIILCCEGCLCTVGF